MNKTNTYNKLVNKPKNNYPEYLVIHHSGGTNANPKADTSHHTAQIMEAHHLSLGWEGLGYHYVIHKNGEVWAGRPEHRNGAHTKEQNINYKSLGINLAGNFDVTQPSQQQIDSLRSLITEKMAVYKIPIEKVVPHRYFLGTSPYKSCFGNNLGDTWLLNLIKKDSISDCEVKLKEKDSIIGRLLELIKKLLS